MRPVATAPGPNTRVAEMEAFQTYLRKRGLKMTAQRRVVVDTIFETDEHFSVENLQDVLKGERAGISKATIYRTLTLLVEAKLLDAVDFDQGHRLYERTVGHGHHDHLICLECRRIIEFVSEEIERIQDRVADAHEFRIINHTHKIYGLCGSCRRKQNGGR